MNSAEVQKSALNMPPGLKSYSIFNDSPLTGFRLHHKRFLTVYMSRLITGVYKINT